MCVEGEGEGEGGVVAHMAGLAAGNREPARERYRVSEPVLQSLEGTETLSRNQAGTRFPEMGPRAEAQ